LWNRFEIKLLHIR